MKITKKIIATLLLSAMLMAVGCNKTDDGNPADNNTQENAENGGIQNQHIELSEGEVVFRAKVITNDPKHYIEAEIVDSQIAFGIYHVLVSDITEFYGKSGEKINRDDIADGDIIEIVFSGQVMNSYPPKIAAKRVYLV